MPSCVPCQRRQGGMLRWRLDRLEADEPGEVVEPIGFDVLDPVWDVAWLDELREVPADATWPRFMTAPHPDAVGSYGGEVVEWARWQLGVRLRWWQRLVLVRLCEHDAAGVLVWRTLILTLARQLGKSWLMRVLFLWRMHHGHLFGEEQTILHTGRTVGVLREVFRLAARYARERPDVYSVREVNSQEEIDCVVDHGRWLCRAKSAVYGYSPTVAAVDEAWDVAAVAVDEGIEPTIVEHVQPWLLLISTAHRKATPLMLRRRASALSMLAAPTTRDLLVEWSAPAISEVDDRGAWRLASPHWSPGREDLIASKVAAALAGETDPDSDEPDPIEAIRTQWLNIWPNRLAPVVGVGERLLEDGVWAACAGIPEGAVPRRVWVSVEDNYGTGAAVAVVGVLDDDRLEVDGWLCGSRDEAMAQAEDVIGRVGVPAVRVIGRSIATRRRVERAGAEETRTGLTLFRSLVAAGRLVHDDTPELDDQLGEVRVREVSGGLALLSGARADLVRAVVWAVRSATLRAPAPSIH